MTRIKKRVFNDRKEHGVDKLIINVDDDVEKYLDQFQNCTILDSLKNTLKDNTVHAGNFNIKDTRKFFFDF
ncbi:8223_t:CDS:2 [Entrophospora sp. SA101]|nr:8223_t:CDS:2 [Entrophospora sp. SA101]